jgi:hypothetical protein
MPIYVLRLRDGNCIISLAENPSQAVERAKPLGGSSQVATIREADSFAAQFSLSDKGELKSVLLDQQTLSELLSNEYPMLNAARAHAYGDFGSSDTDSKTEHVLFDQQAGDHAKGWDQREKSLIEYVVEQERLRLAH